MSAASSAGQEFSAKTVDAAIEEGLRRLGLDSQQVDIEVITRGSRGILGIGSEAARVRITPRPAAPKPAKATSAPPPLPAPEPHLPPPARASDGPAAAAATADTEMSFAADDDDDDAAYADEDRYDTILEDAEGLAELAVELLSEMFRHMRVQATIEASWMVSEDGNRFLNLDAQGQDLGMLIGRHGKTLSSIQYLLRLMINQKAKQWPNVVVDVEQYKARRSSRLTQLALRMAEQVVESGRAVHLEPMPASDRRLIHLALRNHLRVYTQSVGEGERRKVQILLKE